MQHEMFGSLQMNILKLFGYMKLMLEIKSVDKL